jgi:hypothetical protein
LKRFMFNTKRRSTHAAAAILAAVIIFGIMFSVTASYFYFTGLQQQVYRQALKQQANNIQSAQAESFLVTGTLIGGQVAFYINNTGNSISVIAYWIFNATNGAVLQYENTTLLPRSLPFNVGQGLSYTYSNTNITDTNSQQQYVIRVLTTKGTTVVGTYPSNQVATSSLNSYVADGVGALRLTFSSFSWYDYVSGPPTSDADLDYNYSCLGAVVCNGGSWTVDVAHPHTGSLLPSGNNESGVCGYCGIAVPIVFAVNVTNNDPEQGNIILNSATDLWVVETCNAGTSISECGPFVPVYVFYILNMNPATGQIQSTTQGSFKQIQIPYGTSKILYFGSACDLSTCNYGSTQLGTDDSLAPGENLAFYGEFAVFMLFSGTKIEPANVLVYGQNIPLETAITADNLGWYSETPTTATSATTIPFSLQVNNSIFAYGNINEVVVNASAFSSITATTPTGWSKSISGGTITWTNTNNNYIISPGGTLTFSWTGTAPTVTTATQYIFPLTIYWDSGYTTVLQGDAACFVTPNTAPPPTVPLGIVHYVPVTLTNFQTAPVAGGTQVMIPVSWATYSSYLDNPVDNVLFFNFNGNSLNAWMENGTSSSSTNSIIWLQLDSNGIPASSSVTIYMGFYATGSNHLSSSGPFGEASQLSSPFGKYDDGSSVFNYYNNGQTTTGFNVVNGGSLTKTSQTGPFGSSTSVLTLSGKGSTSASSETVAWVTSGVAGDNFVAEGWGNTATNLNAMFAYRGLTSSTTTNYIAGDGWAGAAASIAYESGTTNNALKTAGTRSTGWYWDQVIVTGSTYVSNTYTEPEQGSSPTATATASDNTLPGTNVYVGIATWAGSSSPAYFFQWRVRINPPSGVMPSATFGALH